MDLNYILKMVRVVDAARTLRYAQENKPGEDLGQRAVAACIVELDAALAEIKKDEGEPGFDASTSLKYLLDNRR